MKPLIKKLLLGALVTLVAIVVVLVAQPVLAQVSLGLPTDGFAGAQDANLRDVIENIVRIVLGFLGVIFILLLMYAGWLWMTSQGDEKKISRAKAIIVSSIIGLIITVAAYAISAFIVTSIQRAIGPGGPPPDDEPCLECVAEGCLAPTGVDAGKIKVCIVSPGSQGLGGNVTVKGYNFGNYVDAATSRVNFSGFSSADGVPVACNNTISWSANRITVKVPTTLMLGGPASIFEVLVKNGAESCEDINECGQVVLDEELTPSIDCIDPSIGTRGTEITVKGSNFGSAPDTLSMEGATARFNVASEPANILSWNGEQIKFKVPGIGDVPEAALSGDITVTVDGSESNGKYFRFQCTAATAEGVCASGCCRSNACVDESRCTAAVEGGPVIDSLSPSDGEEGNFITIKGRNFGAAEGNVHFGFGSPATDYVINGPPALACSSTWWSDRQIIFAVPTVGSNGNASVSVETAALESSSAVSFTVNDIVRPGLCLVDPTEGLYNDTVDFVGNNFTGATREILFGGVPGLNTNFTLATEADSQVPNLAPDNSYVSARVDGEESNRLDFKVLSESAGGPRIEYIDPVNGPTSEYIHIYGRNFGSAIGTVSFTHTASGTSHLGDINFPSACALNFWRSSHIVVKVPSDLPLGPGTVAVRTATPENSNSVDFEKNNNPRTPGICLIDPTRAPINYNNVRLVGEGFGSSDGDVTFFENKDASYSSWAGQEVKGITVPDGAQTGLVNLTTSAALESAGIPFEVGSCTNDSQCSGNKCCDGVCKASCTVSGQQCTYAWSFTSAEKPFGLEKSLACTLTTQSPSPYPFWDFGTFVATNPDHRAPVDAVITARFTTDIQQSTVPSGIKIYPCNTGNAFSGGCSAIPITGTFSELGDSGFIFTPNLPLSPNTWYEVELNSALLAVDNSSFQGDDDLGFAWHFHTRSSASDTCIVAEARVAPSEKTIYLGDKASFSSVAIDSSCYVCRSNTRDWDWQADPTYVSFESVNNNQAKIVADKDQVTDGINVTAKDVLSGKIGQATLEILAPDFFVRSFTPSPSCTDACTNITPTATFNMPAQAATISGSTVRLWRCADINCLESGLSGPLPATIAYDPDSLTVSLTPTAPLLSGNWYRATISQTMQNLYSDNLTHLNFPGSPANSFSWKFRSGDLICTPDAVSLSPGNLTRTVGQSINYKAKAIVTTLVGCGPVFLDPDDYNWTWESTTPLVGDFTPLVPNASQQNVTAVNPGSTNIKASLLGLPEASSLLTVNPEGIGPEGEFPPLEFIPPGAPGAGQFCRNVQISATFNNRLDILSWPDMFLVTCGAVACPEGSSVIRGNKVIHQFDNPGDVWPAGATINVQIQAGVKDIYEQWWVPNPAAPDQSWTFTTTDTLCRISYVEVSPDPYTFVTPNSSIVFAAAAKDATGVEITGAEYDWTPLNGPIINVDSSITQNSSVTSRDQNGFDYAKVTATGTLLSQDLGTARGSALVRVDICENPWTNGPDIDTDYDFSLNYCRDAVSTSAVALPDLPNPLIRTGSGDVLREHIFVVQRTDTDGGIAPGSGNNPPSFDAGNDSFTNVNVGDLVYFQLTARDPENDQFTMYASSLPEGATFNPFTGVFMWVPTEGGTKTAIFKLRDGVTSPEPSKSVSISVNDPDGPIPALPIAQMQAPAEGNTITIAAGTDQFFRAISNECNSSSFVWDFQDSGPSSGFLVPGDCTYRVNHTFIQTGLHQVTFRVKGPNGWSPPAVVDVVVTSPVSFETPLAPSYANKSWWQRLFSFWPTKKVQAQAEAGTEYDVIVAQVRKNLEHLAPSDWYRKFAPNPGGAPRSLMVDGYPAIQDGTTVYVAAGNVSAGNAYTNIYLISHNQNADPSTLRIFDRLVQDWEFNYSFTGATAFDGSPAVCRNTSEPCMLDSHCAENDYCTSRKATIRRDVKRFTDTHSVARSLEDYAVNHKFCSNSPQTPCVTNGQCPGNGACVGVYPSLSAGSFVAGMSTSRWPSWNETLSTALGQEIADDPLNFFGDCQTANPGADPSTCWDEQAREFSCPSDSFVYGYQTEGANSYRVMSHMESVGFISWPLENTRIKLNLAQLCTGAPAAGFCGNNIREGAETCDSGFHNACPVGSNHPYTTGCRPNCGGFYDVPAGWDCGGTCGNGAVDTPFEQCEQSVAITVNNCTLGGEISCGSSCQFSCTRGQAYVGECGNGDVELPEACDDGANNGSYGYCNSACSGYGSFCGDNILQEGEQCDVSQGLIGFSCPSGQTLYCSSACQRTCSDLGPATVGACGNAVVEGSEQCEPDLYLTPAPRDSSSTRQYVCADTDTGPLACTLQGGYCDDGIKQPPYESCDYTDQNKCANDPSVSCSRAVCPEGAPCAACPIDDDTGDKGLCRGRNGDICDNLDGSCSYCTDNCQQKFLVKNYCGDGVEAGIETCDNGRFNGLPGKCNASCTGFTGGIGASDCGNGIPEAGEACDHGGLNGTPGRCKFDCSGLDESCAIGVPGCCGNNVPDAGEFCDNDGTNGNPRQCNATCTAYTPAVCGNLIIEDGLFGTEQCDDGNTADNDGCSSTCQNETPPVVGVGTCGDGTEQHPNSLGLDEFCDHGVQNGQNGKCWTDCKRMTRWCGDTIRDNTPANDAGVVETCDSGPANGTVVGGCNVTCNGTVISICLDRVVTNPPETCDRCPVGNGFCKAGGVPLTAAETCTNCNLSSPVAICGNGLTEPLENCDNGGGVVALTNFIGRAGDGFCYGCRWQCGDNDASAPVPQPAGKCTLTSELCYLPDTCILPSVCASYNWTKNEPGGELCDQGVAGNGQTVGQCNSMCYDPATRICGNNTIESGEACDDGAQTGTPGHCGPLCDPSYPAGLCVKDDNAFADAVCNCNNVSCGDSVTSQTCNPATTLAGDGEKCDEGPGNNGPTGGCNTWCSGTCGNGGPLDPGETCDDGALNGAPGQCNSTCSGQTPASCGNGTQELGEVCDFGPGSELNGCTLSHPTQGGQRCCARCGTRCGDGSRSVLEVCDSGVNNGQPGYCNTTCTATLPVVCGDSIISIGEDCEPGPPENINGKSCTTVPGGFTGGDLNCHPASAAPALRCKFDTSACTTVQCGNNALEPNGADGVAGNADDEVCDGTDFGTQTCLDFGFDSGNLSCSADCKTIGTSQCGTCGNNTQEFGEVCDYGSPGTGAVYRNRAWGIFGYGQGHSNEVCISCTTEYNSGVISDGLRVQSYVDAAYFSTQSPSASRLVLAPVCSNPRSDTEGVLYPNANHPTVYWPSSGNACISNPDVTKRQWRPALQSLSDYTDHGTDRSNFDSSWEGIGVNVVAIKVGSGLVQNYAAASFHSDATGVNYLLSNWHVGKFSPSSWKCVSQSSGLATLDVQGDQWWETDFDDSTWGAPVIAYNQNPACQCLSGEPDCFGGPPQLKQCPAWYVWQTMGSCTAGINMFMSAPQGCGFAQGAMYCRLKYFIT